MAAVSTRLFEARLTTDEVAAFKPDPRSYHMAARSPSGCRAKRLRSSHSAAGMRPAPSASGYPVYWCNRLAQPAEELDAPADRVAASLEALPEFLADR